jgi:hypothetical protein
MMISLVRTFLLAPLAIALASAPSMCTAQPSQEKSFRIEITREKLDECKGTLRFFVDGKEEFSTPCWEDPKNLIEAKTYTGCSTTTMKSKGLKSVYLPDSQTGKTGIFIHAGSSPKNSDGCIVCASDKIGKIYDMIERDLRNITVIVSK